MNAGVNYPIPNYNIQNASSFGLVSNSDISMNPSRILASLSQMNQSFSLGSDRNNASISSRDSFADNNQMYRNSAFNVLGRDQRLNFIPSRGDTFFVEGDSSFSFGNQSQTNESIAELLAGFRGNPIPYQSLAVNQASFGISPPTTTQLLVSELDRINQSIGDRSMASVNLNLSNLNNTQPMDLTMLSNANRTQQMDLTLLPNQTQQMDLTMLPNQTQNMDLTLIQDNFAKPKGKFSYKVPDLKLNESSMMSIGNPLDTSQSLITDSFRVVKKKDTNDQMNMELIDLFNKWGETQPKPTSRYWKWGITGPIKTDDFGRVTGDEYEKLTKEYQMAYESYNDYVKKRNSIINKYKK